MLSLAESFLSLPAASLELASAEKAWLKGHPRIETGAMGTWPAFGSTDGAHRFVGINADLVAALNKRLDSERPATRGAGWYAKSHIVSRSLPPDELMTVFRQQLCA